MNYSTLRRRRLVSSRDTAKRGHENASSELAAKLECFTPIIGSKNKRNNGIFRPENTENGVSILKLADGTKEQISAKMESSLRDGFKNNQDRPSSKRESRVALSSHEAIARASLLILPPQVRPKTSKGSRNKSCFYSSAKKKTTENEETTWNKPSIYKEAKALKERRCAQSSGSTRRRPQTSRLQSNQCVDAAFLSLFAK